MTTLHLISHTHWDREWYLTFQQFRIKLVKLIDDLLDLFEKDPNYCYYTLDGQTIVLDDYLYMRPEREDDLRRLISQGRLIVGPWHILPDEFLVSPEATVRNLLQGERTARRFGNKMMTGYIPDPFGHIGQMPQILRGFGIPTASVQRGLDGEPCEFWWSAPDGSQVLMSYLRDGYGNACELPMNDPEGFAREVQGRRDSLLPYSHSGHLLLMHGVDHRPAHPATSADIAYANQQLEKSGSPDRLVHSSLPEYFAAVQAWMKDNKPTVPVVCGELRSSHKHCLLPNVLSTRMWIKQRNNTCETLLEKWAEPFGMWSELVLQHDWPSAIEGSQQKSGHFAPVLRQAWRLLMECHPHDSICGCSIDPVHAEMPVRFDQVEQIGEEVTRQSLLAIASAVNTRPPAAGTGPAVAATQEAFASLVVFNPHDCATGGPVQATVTAQHAFEILDQDGLVIPHEVVESTARNITEIVLDRQGLLDLMTAIETGQARVNGLNDERLTIQDVRLERCPDTLYIQVYLSERPQANPEAMARIAPQMVEYLADDSIRKFIVLPRTPILTIRFVAGRVPAHGYRTYWLRPAAENPLQAANQAGERIENESYILSASRIDGTLTLTDRRTGQVYQGLNRFVDGGDAGDEYNYSPPLHDLLLSPRVRTIKREEGPMGQALHIEMVMDVPCGLSDDRQSRSGEFTPMAITTIARLHPGLARLDIQTKVENPAGDHRLRVHFPAPFAANYADFDGHYEIVRRPIALPEFDQTWIEDPRPEVPQRRFTALHGPQGSLVVANRGLPEVEALTNPAGNGEIALTLLRSVGWLSRGDLLTRRCHAGPFKPTPQAQMLGTWEYEYTVILAPAESTLAAYRQAHAYSTSLRSAVTGLHNGPLSASGSFVQSSPPEFMLCTVKTADDEQGWIVRGYNLTGAPLQARLSLFPAPSSAALANLAEQPGAPLPAGPNGELNFRVRGHEVVTLKLQ